MRRATGDPDQKASLSPLTDRERECLSWSARDKTSWETAIILEISESGVKKSLGTAAAKLGAQSRTQAVAIALSQGMIDLGGADR